MATYDTFNEGDFVEITSHDDIDNHRRGQVVKDGCPFFARGTWSDYIFVHLYGDGSPMPFRPWELRKLEFEDENLEVEG